jgi:hypothetical protein
MRKLRKQGRKNMYTIYGDKLNINFNRINGLRGREYVGKHNIKIGFK